MVNRRIGSAGGFRQASKSPQRGVRGSPGQDKGGRIGSAVPPALRANVEVKAKLGVAVRGESDAAGEGDGKAKAKVKR